jgi:hypothetical protein
MDFIIKAHPPHEHSHHLELVNGKAPSWDTVVEMLQILQGTQAQMAKDVSKQIVALEASMCGVETTTSQVLDLMSEQSRKLDAFSQSHLMSKRPHSERPSERPASEPRTVEGTREVRKTASNRDASHVIKAMMKSEHDHEDSGLMPNFVSYEPSRSCFVNKEREFRTLCSMLLRWPPFEFLVGLVIFANSITIGAEMSLEQKHGPLMVFTILEYIFLNVYIVELLLRGYVDGCRSSLKKPWVVFDGTLVIIGICSIYLLRIVASADNFQEAEGAAKPIMAMRILRLLRLARALRLVQ